MTPDLGSMVVPALIIGLALFLFGMSQLEAGVRTLGYATFKRWLIRSTASATGSVSVGVGVTAVLQSSSMVSLLVLAFASAGVLPLVNAVGILLGANLGTTITGWMVATIGFKLSLQLLALPLMAAGAILQLIPQRSDRLRALGTLVFGFGLLIFGLEIMKNTVEQIALTWDISILRGQPAWVYFLTGAAVAALIQSSSATMMMTLAALNSGLFDLQSAAALVIGADLGTTSTTALGSIGGHVIKRQLALAHVVFNLAVNTGAFFIVLPLLPLLLQTLGLTDPLYSLVAFHSVFNLLGLAVFIPFLQPFAGWIGGRFQHIADGQDSLLGLPTDVPDAALVATAKALAKIRLQAAVLALQTFHITPRQLGQAEPLAAQMRATAEQSLTLEQRYHDIKHGESELLAFSMDLQAQPLNAQQVTTLAQQSTEARAIVYSSKTLKDIRHNLVSMRDSHEGAVVALYQLHRDYLQQFYTRYLALAATGTAEPAAAAALPADKEELLALLADNEAHMQATNAQVRAIAASDAITGSELSNMLNVNREIHHAIKSLITQS